MTLKTLKQRGTLKATPLVPRQASTVSTDPLYTGLGSSNVEDALLELASRAQLIVVSGQAFVQPTASTDSGGGS